MSVNAYAQLLLRVTVDPNGIIQSCGVEEPSESQMEARVDAYTCDLTLKRASFLPARGADGKVTYGVYRLPVVWEMTPYVRKSFPDLTLQVNKLPSGIKSPAMIELDFAADPDGTLSSCEAKDQHQNGALARIGCDQLQKQFKAFAPKTPAEASTSSIQNAFVEFRAK